MLQIDDRTASNAALVFAKALESTFATMFKLHLETGDKTADTDDATRREVHNAVSTILHDFGSGVLTEREREIVRLVLKRHSAKSIANILGITPGTVSIHRSRIYQKLDVSGQGDLFAAFVTQLVGA